MLADLRGERRAARVRINGQERWIDAADAGLYRDALGAAPAGGLPAAFLEDVPDALSRLLRRYAATHGPFTTADVRARYGIDVSAALRELERSGALVRGELRPGGSEREWCDPEVLRRLRRASLAVLRKEIEPAEARELARFLPSWQGIDRHPASGAGIDRLRETLVPLQGLALPAEVWESDVLPRRVGAYSPTWMDQLCAAGEVVWIGAGALGRNSGRVALYFREDLALLGPPPYRGEVPDGEAHEAIRARLAAGACFFTDLLVDVEPEPRGDPGGAVGPGVGGRGHQRRLCAAARPAADAGACPARGRLARRRPRCARRAVRRGAGAAGGAAAQVQGRWSLTEPLLRAPTPGRVRGSEPRRRALGELLLERYGIVTREQVLAEGIPGGFSAIYAELSQLETLGVARRGYFLEGLGGAQFALPGAVERLRARSGAGAVAGRRRGRRRRWYWPPSTRPSPTGRRCHGPSGPETTIPPTPAARHDARRAWPAPTWCSWAATRSSTSSGAGAPCRRWSPPGDARIEAALTALVDHVRTGAIKRVALEKVDGEPAMTSPLGPALLALGFQEGPRRLTLSA